MQRIELMQDMPSFYFATLEPRTLVPLRLKIMGHQGRGFITMRHFVPVCIVLAGFGPVASAHTPPLLPEKAVAALANELSGETAKRNLEGLARFHRQRGSQGFHSAAELVAERARAYGLSDVQILRFPADGKTFYGTQRAR
jgi:hypothetical protein